MSESDSSIDTVQCDVCLDYASVDKVMHGTDGHFVCAEDINTIFRDWAASSQFIEPQFGGQILRIKDCARLFDLPTLSAVCPKLRAIAHPVEKRGPANDESDKEFVRQGLLTGQL